MRKLIVRVARAFAAPAGARSASHEAVANLVRCHAAMSDWTQQVGRMLIQLSGT